MNRKRTLVGVLIFLAVVFGYWLRGCVAVDSCLDAGGRWNYDWDVCERYVDEPAASRR